MITKITYDGFGVYTNQIILPEEFKKLCAEEKVLVTFKTQVNNTHEGAFATFLAEKRHLAKFNEGDLIIFRAIKGNNKFEFISYIGKWGKFHIPNSIIEVLGIKNHEKIEFEVVKPANATNNKTKGNIIDLSNVKENTNFIFRGNNFITLVKKGAIPITLPRFIKISPRLIELCFLIHGDGHYKTKLYFVNKDKELHKFVLDKFEEIFRIPKETWRARLLFNNSANKDKAKQIWKEVLNLKEEQFYPTISKSILNTCKIGNLRIVIDKKIVGIVFRYVFENIQNVNGINSLYALDGLLCAEGSAEKTKNGGLHKITISCSSNEKNMFKEILAESNILKLVRDGGDRFVIEGWDNCYNFFKIFFSNNIIPFDLHKGRCNNALLGFLEHGFTKTMEKYLTILNKKEQMSTNELIIQTNYLGNSVRKILRKKPYTQFVKSIGKGVNRNPIIFSITPEGKEFLTLTKDIKEVYNKRNGLR